MDLKKSWDESFDGDYIKKNIELTESQLKEEKVDNYPELIKLCGKELADTLVKEAGSLKKLSLMRWQTIFTLGSKRFFNSGMRKMCAGHIAKHPDYWKGGTELAKEISVAARKDYFGTDR